MEEIKTIIDNLFKNRLFNSLFIILVSVIIYKLFTMIINKSRESDAISSKFSKKDKTVIRLVSNVIKYAFVLITVLILLQVNGVNVNSMLAGVGIIATIIGLALQDALKDIIRGIDMISDKYFSVGDIVKYGEIEGKVQMIGLKTTKIENIVTGDVISVANRKIEEISVANSQLYVNIPMPYEVKLEQAENIVNEIVSKILETNGVHKCQYIGVNELADSDIKYLIEIRCNPDSKRAMKRLALRTILEVFEEHNISVPYQQIDVHKV